VLCRCSTENAFHFSLVVLSRTHELLRLNGSMIMKIRVRLASAFALMWMALSACSTVGVTNFPRHSFSFDTPHDSPDVEVLDYKYGRSGNVATRPEKKRVEMGQTFASSSASGPIPRGDFLYVKWRLKNRMKMGEYLGTYEDHVDLRNRLPADITGLRIHFVIDGSQLYIYLISPGLKPASEPAGPVAQYSMQKQVKIYPDQLK